MNVSGPLHALLMSVAASYEAGQVDVATMRATSARVRALQLRARALARFRTDYLPRIRARLDMLGSVRATLRSGGTVVALDTGFTRAGPAEQLGVSTWRNDRIETAEYVLSECAEARDIPCLFGPRHIVRHDEMLGVAREASASADLVVFHAAFEDLSKLGLDVSRGHVVDTSWLGWLWYPRTASLETLCARYGLDNSHWHNSGNDAHRTLQVVMAMVDDRTLDDLELFRTWEPRIVRAPAEAPEVAPSSRRRSPRRRRRGAGVVGYQGT